MVKSRQPGQEDEGSHIRSTQDAESKLEMGESINSQRPPTGPCFLQQGSVFYSIPSNSTANWGEHPNAQVFSHTNLMQP